MLTRPSYSGSFDELRARWSEIRPPIAHDARPVTFDAAPANGEKASFSVRRPRRGAPKRGR